MAAHPYSIAPPPPNTRAPSQSRPGQAQVPQGAFNPFSSAAPPPPSSGNNFDDDGSITFIRGSAAAPPSFSAPPPPPPSTDFDDDGSITFIRGSAAPGPVSQPPRGPPPRVEDEDEDDGTITFIRGSAVPPPAASTGTGASGILKGAREAGTHSGAHVRFPSDSKLTQMYSPTMPASPAPPAAGVLYQALYDYNSSEPGDLPFKANDILRVSDEGDGPSSWFFGEDQNGRQGSFPGTFVRKIQLAAAKLVIDDDGAVAAKERLAAPVPAPVAATVAAPVVAPAAAPPAAAYTLCQALYDYNSNDPDDLTFKANDILRVSDMGTGPESWWYGEDQNGRKGSFPGTFARRINAAGGRSMAIGGLEHT